MIFRAVGWGLWANRIIVGSRKRANSINIGHKSAPVYISSPVQARHGLKKHTDGKSSAWLKDLVRY